MIFYSICLIVLAHGASANGDNCPNGTENVDGTCLYRCTSDLDVGPVVLNDQKGIAVDDTTFDQCMEKLPYLWPNTEVRMKSLRLFGSWKSIWGGKDKRDAAWAHLKRWVVANGAKVLIGSTVSCDEDEDENEWQQTKELLQLLGRDHIMGLAVGNELELLFMKDKKSAPDECIEKLWGQRRYIQTTFTRVGELDALPGFAGLPITGVFGGFAFGGEPFVDIPQAMVSTYLTEVWKKYGERFRFSWNFYPYFNTGLQLDQAGAFGIGSLPTLCPNTPDCQTAVNYVTDYGPNGDIGIAIKTAAKKQLELTGNPNAKMWIGEIGWSAPRSDTLNGNMVACPRFSASSTLLSYYTGFLNWDLTVEGLQPPEHAFYFTPRDSFNFKVEEHFGLIGSCDATKCKLNSTSHIFTSGSCGIGEKISYSLLYLFLFSVCCCWIAACCGFLVWHMGNRKHSQTLDEDDESEEGGEEDEVE